MKTAYSIELKKIAYSIKTKKIAYSIKIKKIAYSIKTKKSLFDNFRKHAYSIIKDPCSITLKSRKPYSISNVKNDLFDPK